MNPNLIIRRASQLAQSLRLDPPEVAISALLSAVLPVLKRAGKPADAFWEAMNGAQVAFFREHPLPTFDRPKIAAAAEQVADLIATMDHTLRRAGVRLSPHYGSARAQAVGVPDGDVEE